MRFKDVLNKYAVEGNIEMLGTAITAIGNDKPTEEERVILLNGALFCAARNDHLPAVKCLLKAGAQQSALIKASNDPEIGASVKGYYNALKANALLRKDVREQDKILNTLAIAGASVSVLGAAFCLTSAFLVGKPLFLAGVAIILVGVIKAAVCLAVKHHNACRLAESDALLSRS